jgi:putative hydrolase of the HAD superfamily
MNKPEAVLFDLDDTLMKFDIVSDLAWKTSCDDFVRNNPVCFSNRELFECLFKIRKWYWSDPVRHKKGRNDMKNARREVFGHALRELGFDDSEKIIETADGYTRLQEALWELFDGTVEALQSLQNLNIRMAVVTNGPSAVQRGKLERFGITRFFNHIIIDTEVGFSKPDARIFQTALDRLSLPPSAVWMIGDNLEWDVMGPQQLGIFSVWNDYRQKGLPPGSSVVPDMIVGSVAEMAGNIEVL